MFSSFDGQTISRVMVDHFRNRQELARKIAKLEISSYRIPLDSHVHEAFGTPEDIEKCDDEQMIKL